MKNTLVRQLLLTICLCLLPTLYSVKAQLAATKQLLDYYELKELLLKHKETAESILSMKRFKLASNKERPESTIYAYKKRE